MRRVLGILLVAVLSGSMVGEVIPPPVDPCARANDCCAPDAGCDENCVVCLRCANHTPSLLAFFSADPLVVPVSSAATTTGALTLPLLSTDILHVPRSL